MSRQLEMLTWLSKVAPDHWPETFEYHGVPLIAMDREALMGLIYVLSRAIEREVEKASRERTEERVDG